VTLSPGESIQGAIDQASVGDVICLRSGEYDEALKISKHITLRGLGGGPGDVKIRWTGDFDHVVRISGSAEVVLEKLTLTKREQFVCLVRAEEIACSAALLVEGQATVTAEEVRLEGSGVGLLAQGSSVVEMKDAEASKNAFGVFAEGEAQLTWESPDLGENSFGVVVRGSAQLHLQGGEVAGNEFDGLKAEGEASLVLEGVTVEGNGKECEERRMICNGVTVRERAQLTLRDSTVKKNADWGLSAVRTECGYPRDDFEGIVRFEGENTIEENDVFRHQRARGNPGDHPWGGEDVEGGQVCLP
jgi:nitrous oxidase accessory protein NosD